MPSRHDCAVHVEGGEGVGRAAVLQRLPDLHAGAREVLLEYGLPRAIVRRLDFLDAVLWGLARPDGCLLC